MVGGGALVSQPKILSSIVSNRFLHSSHPCQLHQLFRYGAGLSLPLSMCMYIWTTTMHFCFCFEVSYFIFFFLNLIWFPFTCALGCMSFLFKIEEFVTQILSWTRFYGHWNGCVLAFLRKMRIELKSVLVSDLKNFMGMLITTSFQWLELWILSCFELDAKWNPKSLCRDYHPIWWHHHHHLSGMCWIC